MSLKSPELGKRRLPSGTVAFLFTDIQGSTKLFHALGDDYLRLLEEHHAVLRAAFEAHDGCEVKTEGDAFFVAFSDPLDAVLACRDAQVALAAFSFSHGEPVKVRMGLHVGSVTIVEDDYVGLSVHEAARVAGAAYGGQVLLSEEVVDAVAARLPDDVSVRDLGRHALKDFPDPKHLFQLVAPGMDAAFPAPKTLTARGHNLPASPTRIVGREEDLLHVQGLFLGDARLVTLTGAGGFGKSRLAIEAGWSLLSWFREGVWFVPLAAVTDERDIVPTINRALGVTDDPQREPVDQLIEHLKAGPTLLVLDNLEQLGDGVVLVADLLAACPDLHVLATSRERLRLRGEHEIELDGLSLDSAAELFAERARAQRPSIDLDAPDTAAAINALAAKLDGIPLALELAAALVRDLSPVELVGQLDRSMELLTEGERDLPKRQRTLRSTIAWSHDLLSDDDKQLFDLLAVFSGGVPLPALTAVARRAGIAAGDEQIASGMERLVDKALVRRAEERQGDTTPRWWLLETIRQFASERLEEHPDERDAHRDAHASWFAGWVEQLGTTREIEQGTRFDLLARDVDNLRVSLQNAHDGQRVRLAVHLAPFWEVRGHWREGVRWLDEVDATNVEAADRCRLLVARGRLDRCLVRIVDAERRLREAKQTADTTDDAALRASCAAELAAIVLDLAAEEGQSDELVIDSVERSPERMAEATELLRAAIALAIEARDELTEASSGALLSKLLLDQGDAESAMASAAAAIDQLERLGDRRNAALTSVTLASGKLQTGDVDGAAVVASTGAGLARSVGDGSTEGQLLWVEAIALAGLDRFEEAGEIARAAHDLFVEIGDESSAAGILFIRGQIAARAGDVPEARRWFSASADAWRAFGDERRAGWCEDAIAQIV